MKFKIWKAWNVNVYDNDGEILDSVSFHTRQEADDYKRNMKMRNKR